MAIHMVCRCLSVLNVLRCCCDVVDRLLKEAEPLEEKRNVEMGDERSRVAYSEDENVGDSSELEERKLLSRYGVWLLVELTPAKEDVPIVSLLYCLQSTAIQNTPFC